jgi:nucleoside-diphosphate kinase
MNPHAGRIIDIVLRSGIEVSGLRIVKFSRIHAERLLDIYRGVLRDFGAICDEISSGPSMILEVRQDDISSKMKALCGPADPDMARIVAPDSIRAVFGISSILNAIHVTELEEEGPRECHYAFGLCD